MIQEKIRSIIKEDFSREVNAVDVRDGYLILSVPTVALDFRMRYLLPMLDAELRAQVPGYSKLRGLQVKTRGI
ncbi:MAG: hypothetical protein GY862_05060, partial [Gammaproteobacteria bacterium]|nr:hypothetical protein [Gammaproteobacteria bacterium]